MPKRTDQGPAPTTVVLCFAAGAALALPSGIHLLTDDEGWHGLSRALAWYLPYVVVHVVLLREFMRVGRPLAAAWLLAFAANCAGVPLLVEAAHPLYALAAQVPWTAGLVGAVLWRRRKPSEAG